MELGFDGVGRIQNPEGRGHSFLEGLQTIQMLDDQKQENDLLDWVHYHRPPDRDHPGPGEENLALQSKIYPFRRFPLHRLLGSHLDRGGLADLGAIRPSPLEKMVLKILEPKIPMADLVPDERSEFMAYGLNTLRKEAEAFLEKGTEAGFANPQSIAEGLYAGKKALVNGREQVDVTRLDYLSLGQNGVVREIMKNCLDQFNVSCPTSQMALKSETNIRLEKAIADFHGMEDSVMFLSGYCANENIIQALAFRSRVPHLLAYARDIQMGFETRDIPTEFFMDEESHYSLQYAIRSAKAQLGEKCLAQRFPTQDHEYLRKLLKRSYDRRGDKSFRVIVSDTISSMSGKVYDVKTLCEIAEEFDCLLYLDEAHAIGTWGEEGRGIASELKEFERYKDRVLIMGTLTKAVSQLGGYVAVPDTTLSCFLRACSPYYIFSAPLSPWLAEVVIQILDLIKGGYGKEERKKLWDVSGFMRQWLKEEGFEILGSESQIIPVLIGQESKSIQAKAFLESRGYAASLFIFPAVPKGKSILRFSLCSDITRTEVEEIVSILKEAKKEIEF
jgi:7-keto-8-aminopelargonate synthetase-like enzyme